MITPFDIYLIGSIDGISALVGGASIISFGLVIFFWMGYVAAYNKKDTKSEKKCFRNFVYSLVCGAIFALTAILLPSSKTLAAMYIVPPVMKSVQENKQINQIPQAVLDLIKSYTKKEDTNDNS
jgi:uncharacterized membrane protein